MERLEREFATWGEWVEFCKLPIPKDAKSSHSTGNENAFNGGMSYSQAVNAAEFGWPEGIKLITPLREALMTKLANLVPVTYPYYHVTGRFFDVAAVVDGEPEQWIDYDEELSDSFKAVTIVVNGSYSCGVEPKVVLARGACVAALVDLLELTNVRCTVILDMGFSDSTYKDSLIAARVTVKTFDQPLDLNRLAYSLAHASSFRRLGFRMLEANPKYHEAVGVYNYGYPGQVPKDRQGNIYIPQMQYGEQQWLEPKFCREWVMDNLRSQGIHLLGDSK